MLEQGAWRIMLVAAAIAMMGWGCSTMQPEPPKLVEWTVESSHPYVLAGGETESVIHVELSALLPEDEQQRIPLNISLVLDHSGSMSGEQMDDARRAVNFMLSKLGPNDKVSVVAFSTQAKLLQEQAEWDDVDKQKLRLELEKLEPRGTTAMFEALKIGINEVGRELEQGSISRVILFSDGIPNDANQLMSQAQQARNRNIAITTMGLGPYYNEDLMAQIADTSGGNYRFIKSSDQLEKFFLEEKQSMEQLVARDINLEFYLGPGVEVIQTLGGSAQISGRKVSLFLGEIGPSEKRQVGLRLRTQATASGAKVELLDAHVSWDDVIYWSGYRERWDYLAAEATLDKALIDQKRDAKLAEKVGRLRAAWEMERAIRDYQAGHQKKARERLEKAASQYRIQREEARSMNTDDSPVYMDSELSIQSGVGSLDVYIEGLAEELEETEPESDKGKILIKKTKSSSRKLDGR